ncbi:MAG TPA: zinc-dependent metalloprotease [bacterium]|nr:zinc-dependent metalloprotease [bacterium]
MRPITHCSRWLLMLVAVGVLAAPASAGGVPPGAMPPGGMGPGGPGGAPQGPAFADVVRDCARYEGLFDFYRNEDTGQLFLALDKDQIGPRFLLSATLNAGSGSGAYIAPMMYPEIPVYFKQTFKTVQLVRANSQVKAKEGTPIARAVASGTSDSVLMNLMPLSEPDPKTGKLLFDANMIFAGDPMGLGMGGGSPFGMPGGGADPMGTFITDVRTFPENSNIEVTQSVGPSMFDMMFGGDTSTKIIKMVYVLSPLPANDYHPRLSDERVGYFLSMHQDYTDDTRDTRYVRYINRWRLEKKDPSAALSEPVEPIVYWIENTVPEQYREAVRQGIEGWQPAFEAAGFKNAIIAKQMPDDADWDPADIRYNVIRWFVAPGASFAIGPSRANPFTGQIYDADIGWSADMVAFGVKEYQHVVDPLGMIQKERAKAYAMGLPVSPTVLELPQFALNPEEYANRWKLMGEMTQTAGAGGRPAAHFCNFADEASSEAAMAHTALVATGKLRPGSVEEAQFVNDFITSITLHEVGHTLGLRHNYKASNFHDHDALATDHAHEAGLTGSVMDYTAANIASRARTQGHYFQTKVGPYDILAVKYGYTPIAGADSPEEELPELAKLAATGATPGHLYATDEDTFGWTAAMDPSSAAWDLASNNIDFYADQLQVAREIWTALPGHYGKSGARFQKFRDGFGWGMRQYVVAGMNVPRYIGGIYHNRFRVGDRGGSNPYVPVPATKQREALNFLVTNYFAPGAFQFDPELIQRLAVEREPDFTWSSFMLQRRDFPLHDVVLGVQSGPLMWVYDPLVLGRIQDSKAMLPAGSDHLTMAELFGAVRGAVWQEAFEARSVDSFRRNLQRQQLEAVANIFLYGKGIYPEDALSLARLDLVTLKGALDTALAGKALDGITRAHFQESRDRISALLSAQMERFPQRPMFGGMMF